MIFGVGMNCVIIVVVLVKFGCLLSLFWRDGKLGMLWWKRFLGYLWVCGIERISIEKIEGLIN